MRRSRILGLLLTLAACEARISGPPELLPDARPVTDAAPPIDSPGIIQLGPWSMPVTVSSASDPASSEDDVTLSSNTLELLFAIASTDPMATGKDLYYTSRSTVGAAWSPPVRLPFNSSTSDETPRLSADDKTLYFASGRAGNGNLDIFTVTRAAAGSATTWASPAPLMPVNTTTRGEKWLALCEGDRYILAQSEDGAQPDLVEGIVGGPAPRLLDELNSTGNDTAPFLVVDCLTVYFASTRAGGGLRIYRSQRASPTAVWSPPEQVTDFATNPGGNQEDPWLSTDGKTFAFVSDAAGNRDVYLSTRDAVVGAR
jgi:Tol biopolymer transport system component